MLLSNKISTALSTIGIFFLIGLGLPQTCAGQIEREHSPSFNLEVNGGVAFFSRFLEQRLPNGDRELVAATAPGVEVAVGYRPWTKAGFRILGSFVPSDLEFRTDTGDESTQLDIEDVSSLDVWTFGVEIMRFVSLQVGPLTPFASGGIVGSMWSLDSQDAVPGLIVDDDETKFRVGLSTRVGLQLDATQQLSIRLESSALSLRNPFDGEDSFRVVNAGSVFDEPEVAPIVRFSLGLAYAF